MISKETFFKLIQNMNCYVVIPFFKRRKNLEMPWYHFVASFVFVFISICKIYFLPIYLPIYPMNGFQQVSFVANKEIINTFILGKNKFGYLNINKSMLL